MSTSTDIRLQSITLQGTEIPFGGEEGAVFAAIVAGEAGTVTRGIAGDARQRPSSLPAVLTFTLLSTDPANRILLEIYHKDAEVENAGVPLSGSASKKDPGPTATPESIAPWANANFATIGDFTLSGTAQPSTWSLDLIGYVPQITETTT